ncbi:steroid receptor-associated and regulated protein [Callithrix jacchus]|uniref:Steroid receptor associated and regulated protein n=1 Tax=Callithrix jacchus TaxID=9483 RepID=A0A8I3W4Z9_CALJA|nr:steroid receptor-associated and regulated protein [Callithrix jacchus]
MAPSEDPRDWRASLKGTICETGLETSSGGKLARRQNTVPTAHLTFVIDCAHRKQLSLAATPSPPQAPSPNRGLVTPPMKTYIVFCGENWPHLTRVTPSSGGCLAQARATLPPCRGTTASASFQEVPEAKGRHLKAMPVRSSTWGTVKDSLKALSSCVCGQAD